MAQWAKHWLCQGEDLVKAGWVCRSDCNARAWKTDEKSWTSELARLVELLSSEVKDHVSL